MVGVYPEHAISVLENTKFPEHKHNATARSEKAAKVSFFRKYFLAGQQMSDPSAQEIPENADFIDRFLITKRKYIAFAFPVVTMHVLWWLTAYRYNWFHLFEYRWQMPVVMFFGSTIAGMTSEGGGAVAFPVMTLLLHIDPVTARDFSLMIQTFGMGSALFVILFMRVQVEQRGLLFGCLGSIPGMCLGFAFVDDLFDAAQKKMLFVSIWSSFAIALYLLNSHKKRVTYSTIPAFKPWKAAALTLTGFVGGIFTSFAGSGVDICIFAITTLLFRVSEKTATPTTVVLMALNSMVGFFCRLIWYGDVSDLTIEYLKVSIPVAVTMAPVGSFIGSHFHRQVQACFVYVLEALSLIGFLITMPSIYLVITGAVIIAVAFVFFSFVSKLGELLLEKIESANDLNQDLPPVPVRI